MRGFLVNNHDEQYQAQGETWQERVLLFGFLCIMVTYLGRVVNRFRDAGLTIHRADDSDEDLEPENPHSD